MGNTTTTTNTEVVIATKVSILRQIMDTIIDDMSGRNVSDEEASMFYTWNNSVRETAQIIIQCYAEYLKCRDGALEVACRFMQTAYKQLLMQSIYKWFPAIFSTLDGEMGGPQRFFRLLYKKTAFEGLSKLDELENGYQRVGDAFFNPVYTDSPIEYGVQTFWCSLTPDERKYNMALFQNLQCYINGLLWNTEPFET